MPPDQEEFELFHIFLDGCLIESKVRSQKAVALSSGEAEFTAILAGSSEALFVKHVIEFMLKVSPKIKARSDSSAARSLTSRQGVGRVRRIESGMVWTPEKVQSNAMEVTAIPTLLNNADIGTKNVSQYRLKALAHILSMVDEYDIEIGEEEFNETETKSRMQKKVNKVMSKTGQDMNMALIALVSMIAGVESTYKDRGRKSLGGLRYDERKGAEHHRSLERGYRDVVDDEMADQWDESLARSS